MHRIVYLDNAATTKVHPQVLEAMLPYFSEYYANPSSIYKVGRDARKVVEDAREDIARYLNAQPKELVFTSCATESNNLAIKGVAYAQRQKGNHIITSTIEHSSVIKVCKELEREGFEVTYIPVDEFGVVDTGAVKNAIKKATVLISIMFANNEVGSVQPIAEIGKIARASNIIFHTDAVQAIGKVKIDIDGLNIDMLSLSGHKIYAPKGIGALYIRKGTSVKPMLVGGEQEFSKRAGTENVVGIVGLYKAIELAHRGMNENVSRMNQLKRRLMERISSNIEGSHINGSPTQCLPNILNVSFENVEGEAIILSLDAVGVYVSTGSACASGSVEPSHILLAMGLDARAVRSSIRFSIGIYNTEEDVDYTADKFIEVISRLRSISPFSVSEAIGGVKK